MTAPITYTAAALAMDAWMELWFSCWGFTRRMPRRPQRS
jgi:hypothetical protein